MAISNTVLSTTTSNVYISVGTTVVSVMYFCNTSETASNFNLYAVAAGGSASNATQIYKNVQIAGGDTFVIDMEKLALATGDSLMSDASTPGAITATVSYVRL